MSKLQKNSIYRTALQVSAETISGLDDTGLSELMRDLFRAQAHRCGSPTSEIRVNSEDKAKDGGCDGWTAKPKLKDDWLGDKDTCWQLKSGIAGSPARLKGEVIKLQPKQTLMAGGRFVVVASASTNGKKGEEDRLEVLTKEALAAGIPTEWIEVIGSERLTEWCNQNPAVAAGWAGSPNIFWNIKKWAKTEVHQVPWQATIAINEEMNRIRAALEYETGSAQHYHIYGPPGVGKTRFALELCREASWADEVIYVQQAGNNNLLELISSAVEDIAVRLVLVADNIEQHQLSQLYNEAAHGAKRIRLITLGLCDSPDTERIKPFRIDPIEPDLSAKVIRGWYPAMPYEHIRFIVQFADGYMQLAWLAASAVSQDPTLKVPSLLNRAEIRAFLDKMLNDDDRGALYVVAVLSRVGWDTEELQKEAQTIAELFSIEWNNVREKIDKFHRLFKIIPYGGRYRYISPTPLGNYLAQEAWTTFPDILRKLPKKLPNEDSIDAYYERIALIASNPQSQEFARQELSLLIQLTDLENYRKLRRWFALSAADSEFAACKILQVIEGANIEERLKIKDQARREIVRGLMRLAWGTRAFYSATKCLALLAEAENEMWGNNATASFIELFQIRLSGTAKPYLDRLALLDELLTLNRISLIRLALKALARAGADFVSRMEGAAQFDKLPEQEWQPKTAQEYFTCILEALKRLITIVELGVGDVEEDLILAAKSFADWLQYLPIRRAVIDLFNAMRSKYPHMREPLRKIIADKVRLAQQFWKELFKNDLDELNSFLADFEGTSLSERLVQLIGQMYLEPEEVPNFWNLAQELIKSPSTLTDRLPWLTSEEALEGWRLGEIMAEEDTERHVLEIIDQNLDSCGTDLRFVLGYLRAAKQNQGNDWFDSWVQKLCLRKPCPIQLLFEIPWRCGITPSIALCLINILQGEQVPAETVSCLTITDWGGDFPPALLDNMLKTLIGTNHVSTALSILAPRAHAYLEERKRWLPFARELLTSPSLIRNEGNEVPLFWEMLALVYIEELLEEITCAIIREHGNRSSRLWFVKFNESAKTVLLLCVERNPTIVWQALESYLSNYSLTKDFGAGFPKGILEQLPLDQIMAWIKSNPDERISIIAKLSSKDFSSDETISSRILGEYGDRKKVADAFYSEYVSGEAYGCESAHWEQLGKSLEEVAKRTKLLKLRHWARKYSSEILEMAERAKIEEEEEKIGISKWS